jgi:HIRAN domain
MAAKKKSRNIIHTRVVGLQYRMSRDARYMLAGYAPFKVRVERDPKNSKDENAIAVYTLDEPKAFQRMQLGYLPKDVAAVLAPALDNESVAITDATVMAMRAVEGDGELKLRIKPV